MMAEQDRIPPSERPEDLTLTLSGIEGGVAGVPLHAVGFRIGKYRLGKLIGRGGMGVVYEAHDVVLQRVVALKVLSRRLTGDAESRKRFLLEARLAARLNHVNAVAVYDVGQQDEIFFIAMELVRGRSMDKVLTHGGALSVEKATRIMMGVCQALGEAHQAGLIHRDIKPANILLAENGTVKISDFGLAMLHDDGSGKDPNGLAALIGTPLYMSPEQCHGRSVDQRTDVYALGATYFALLVGRPPFGGNSVEEILEAQCSASVPDPAEHVTSDLPAGCTSVIRRSMAKKQEDRYPSVAAMLVDLQAVMAELSGTGAGSAGSDLSAVFEILAGGQASETGVNLPPLRKKGRSWLAPLAIVSAVGLALVFALAVMLRHSASSLGPHPGSTSGLVRAVAGDPAPAIRLSEPTEVIDSPVATMADPPVEPEAEEETAPEVREALPEAVVPPVAPSPWESEVVKAYEALAADLNRALAEGNPEAFDLAVRPLEEFVQRYLGGSAFEAFMARQAQALLQSPRPTEVEVVPPAEVETKSKSSRGRGGNPAADATVHRSASATRPAAWWPAAPASSQITSCRSGR